MFLYPVNTVVRIPVDCAGVSCLHVGETSIGNAPQNFVPDEAMAITDASFP